MKYMIILSISISLLFLSMKHPLSMGFLLLSQTINSSIMIGYWLNSYLMSYILFLILVGGMLILFMYMSSIASNEKFFMSNSLLLMFILSLLLIFMMLNYKMNNLNFNFNYSINSYEYFNLSKLYMMPTGIITILVVIYLLFTMIVIINIISQNIAPLRSY
uniref:NADH-ubiquinone oxidoreductase chain 6 n=1 Tax=Derotettix mendosensis TaxID=2219932 RepID=A0A3S7MGH9_9HEMI|nr:NADH dehydrogenase subunit 6 [Derotettix mendosensis]